MNNQLLKLLNLAQKNNDRLVIYNPENPENSFVAVSLKDYEKLSEKSDSLLQDETKEKLTETNSDDKIESVNESPEPDDLNLDKEEASQERETYQDPNLPTSVKDVLENKKQHWQISNQVKESATEVIE